MSPAVGPFFFILSQSSFQHTHILLTPISSSYIMVNVLRNEEYKSMWAFFWTVASGPFSGAWKSTWNTSRLIATRENNRTEQKQENKNSPLFVLTIYSYRLSEKRSNKNMAPLILPDRDLFSVGIICTVYPAFLGRFHSVKVSKWWPSPYSILEVSLAFLSLHSI